MVVAETYIPIRTLQRYAPAPVLRVRPLWGRIAMFAGFFASAPLLYFHGLRIWIGLFLLFDATVFVLTDKRPQLQMRVARTRNECGAS